MDDGRYEATRSYDDDADREALEARLLAAQREYEAGVPTIPAQEVFASLRDMIRARAGGEPLG